MENNITRIYKTTESHRKGNMTKELFLKDFSFDKITFSENLSDKERQESLNATYDALYDLSEVLDVSPYILTLRDKTSVEKCIHIGQKVGSIKDLFIDVKGLVAYNWFKFLDNYLGELNGFVDGYISNLSKIPSDEESYGSLFKKLISVIKYKEVSVDNSELNKGIKGNIDEILEVLDNMPIFKEVEPEEYNNIENSRDAFIRELTPESYQTMKKFFARHNFFVSRIDEEVIKKNLREIRNKRIELSSASHDLVKTDYFTLAKSLSNENRKFANDTELVAFAFNQYIYQTLKMSRGINNHLCSAPEDVELAIKNQSEAFDIYEVFTEILGVLIPIISSNVVLTEVKVPQEEETEVTQVDVEELKKDKNKFKLTLFKKMLDDKGVKISKTTTVSSQYCLTIDDSCISYLMAPINVYSTDKGQKVDVFVLENANSKANKPYRWDYELSYEDLVDFIAKIHISSKDKKVQEDGKETNSVFNIETFETACARHKLTIKSHKIVENNSKMYINNVITNNDFLHFYFETSRGQLLKRVSTYTHYNLKDVNRLVCSFIGVDDSVNVEWSGRPNYDELAKEIASTLKSVLDKSRVATNQIKQEKEREENNIDNSLKLKEYVNPNGITTTDALRKRLVKYINDRKDKPAYILNSHNFINILKTKACGNPDYPYYSGIIRGNLPDNEVKGNSKSWGVKDNVLIIPNKADDRKAIEGAIEATITKFIAGSKYSAKNKKLVSEGLTYMFAKYYNLDVRTYCQSELFEKLISSEKETKEYLSAVIKLFNKFIYLMR